MKRSEMVSRIVGKLHEFQPDRAAWDICEQADILLSIIEEAGMMPPNLYPYDKIERIINEDGSEGVKVTYKGMEARAYAPTYKWGEE